MFFHSATSIKSNVLPYVESQHSQNQHTQFYSYAGNSNKYQIFNTQQTFYIGNLVSVWLRIEDINKPIPTKTADVMVFFLKLYKRYNKMKDIFEFNHIDTSLSESDIKTLKGFYKHYYKKCCCFKKSYKRFKRLDETITISGICLIIIGTITGGIYSESNYFGCL